MLSSIQVSKELVDELRIRKLFGKESYEDVIWSMIEDTEDLNEDTKKEIIAARSELQKGECVTLGEAKNRLGFN